VRDALYGSMLTLPRAALHLRIAEELERRNSNRLAEVASPSLRADAACFRDDKAMVCAFAVRVQVEYTLAPRPAAEIDAEAEVHRD
jgi:hypothetical protein